MEKKYVFIVNPVAGKRDSSLILVPELLEFIKDMGIDGKIELTTGPRDAQEISQRYIEEGDPLRIVSCGGDGTLNEVVTAAKGHDHVSVCQIPCGSGNDFIHSIGAKEDFFDLHRNVLNGTSKPVDLLKIEYSIGEEAFERIGIAICSVGFDADIASNIPKYRRLKLLGGKMAYNVAILERLTKPFARKLTIRVGDEIFEGEFLLTTVANSSYYGGGFCAAPRAVIDDGVLDFCVVKKVALPRFIKVVGRYKRGAHYSGNTIAPELRDVMEARRVKEVEMSADSAFIANFDGECITAENLKISVLEKAVEFVIPQGIG